MYRSSRRRRPQFGGDSPHQQIQASAQLDAKTVRCEVCKGEGRVVMRSWEGGSWEMGWACFTCDPDERVYWKRILKSREGSTLTERVMGFLRGSDKSTEAI